MDYNGVCAVPLSQDLKSKLTGDGEEVNCKECGTCLGYKPIH